jgi:hypothetical protein
LFKSTHRIFLYHCTAIEDRMLNKSFSFYGSSGSYDASDAAQLVVEVGRNHLACMVRSSGDVHITAFELYTFSEEDTTDFDGLIANVVNSSGILNKTFTGTNIYINNECAVLVPLSKFSKDIANDYMRLAFGEDASSIAFYDQVKFGTGVMNVYRVPQHWIDVLAKNLSNAVVKHSYSKILDTIAAGTITNEAIYAQFYSSYIIVCCYKDGLLSLVQSYEYQSPEDVLYDLLNISRQLSFTGTDLTLHVSGMIDLKSTLYDELRKYFENVEVDVMDESLLAVDVHEHPAHYFTPFFKLAV